MTTQLLSAVPTKSHNLKASGGTGQSSTTAKSVKLGSRGNGRDRIEQLVQSYPVLHQVKYLHLEADIELLLQQLQIARH